MLGKAQIEEIDRSRLTSVFEQERDWSRFVILSIPVGTTRWKGVIALPFGNIRTFILIQMVIHTCLADLLPKAFKRLFHSSFGPSRSYSCSGVPVSTWFSQLSKRVLLSNPKAYLEALEFSKYWYEFSTWTRTVTS